MLIRTKPISIKRTLSILLLVFLVFLIIPAEAQLKRNKSGMSKSGRKIEIRLLKKKPGKKKSNIYNKKRKGKKYSVSSNKSRYQKNSPKNKKRKAKSRYYNIKRDKKDGFHFKKIINVKKNRKPNQNPRKYSSNKVKKGKSYAVTKGYEMYSGISKKKQKPNSIRLFEPKKGKRQHSNRNTTKRSKKGKTYSVSTSQNRYSGMKKIKKKDKRFSFRLFKKKKTKNQHANRNTQKIRRNGKTYSVSTSTKLYGKGNRSHGKTGGLRNKKRLRNSSPLKFLSINRLLNSGKNKSSGPTKTKRRKGKKFSFPTSTNLYKDNNRSNRKKRKAFGSNKKKYAKSSSKKLHRSTIKRRNKTSKNVRQGNSDFSRLNNSLTKRRTQHNFAKEKRKKKRNKPKIGLFSGKLWRGKDVKQ